MNVPQPLMYVFVLCFCQKIMPASYAIVNFVDTNEVEVVPLTWIENDQCFWPPLKSREVQRLVKAMSKPCSDWIHHTVKVMKKYATYEDARRHLKKAEDVSDLASDSDAYGKGKRKHYIYDHSDNSTDNSDNQVTFTEATGIAVPNFTELHTIIDQQQKIPQHDVHVGQTILQGNYEVIAEVPTVQEQTSDFQLAASTDVNSALRALTKEVLVIKANQRLILQNQQEIMNLLTCEKVRDHEATEKVIMPFNLPVSSIEDITVIEESVQDPVILECLIEKVSYVGGATVDATVKRVLRKLLTNKVAQHYSWLGAKGKDSFSNLQLSSVIFAAVRRNSGLGSVTDSSIETAIKNWLRHAKARFLSENAKQN